MAKHAWLQVLVLVLGGTLGAACSDKPAAPPKTADDLAPPPDTAPPPPEAMPDDGPLLSMDGSPHSAQAIATLPGFRAFRDGRSRVFVEISEHVPIAELLGTVKIVYRLKGVRVPDRVNRMDMPATFFDASPVARTRLVQVGEDADVVIDLRQPVRPEASVHRTPFGTRLVVTFPQLDPEKADPHYRDQDELSFGYDVLHKHTPYGEENRRLIHDHEGSLHPKTDPLLGP